MRPLNRCTIENVTLRTVEVNNNKCVPYTMSLEQALHMDDPGKRIRELREARGWTQTELAEKVRISGEYVRLIETGHRKPKPQIAALLRVISVVRP